MRLLFRQEATPKRQQEVAERMFLQHPPATMGALYLLGGIFGLVLLFSIVFDYKQKARLEGVVIPNGGLSRIYAPSNGIASVDELKEGASVRVGMQLARLQPIKAVNDAALKAAKDQSIAERESALKNEVTRHSVQHASKVRQAQLSTESIERQLTALRAQEEHVRSRVQSVERQLERFKGLLTSGFISTAQYDDKSEALVDEKAKHEALKASIANAEKNLIDSREELVNLPILHGSANDDFGVRHRELQKERSQFNSDNQLSVITPIDGVIAAISVKNGQFVQEGQLMLTVVPDTREYQVALFAPPDKAGQIRASQEVVLRIAAFPYEKYGQLSGVVKEISAVALSNGDAVFDGSTMQTGQSSSYRVVVAVDVKEFQRRNPNVVLKPGLTLQGDIVVERRRLLSWAFSIFQVFFDRL